MKRKKMWYFGAGVFTMVLMILPTVVTSGSYDQEASCCNVVLDLEDGIGELLMDPEIHIGDVVVKWIGGFFGQVNVKFNLRNIWNFTVEVVGDTVHIDVRADCYLTLVGEPFSSKVTRGAYFKMVCELDNGEYAGESNHLHLNERIDREGTIIAHCKFKSSVDETRVIKCEVIVVPCIEIIGLNPENPLLRVCRGKEIGSCLIEVNIIHIQ